MKKIIMLLALLTASFSLFAKNDIQFRLCPVFSQVDYKLGDEILGNASTGAELGVINYNFFGEEEHFGVFEMLSVLFEGSGCFDFSIGAAFGNDLSEAMRFQGGLGLNFFYAISEDYGYSDEGYDTKQSTKIQFGFTGDASMKFTPHRLFSPVIGINFNYNPFCVSHTITDGKSVRDDYSYYSRFAFLPYVSFCINLN